jgi:3-phytase
MFNTMKYLNYVLSIFLFISCTQKPVPFQRQILIKTHAEYDSLRNKEAREDSVKMAMALQESSQFLNIVVPSAETSPVESLQGEDAADDPAIWVNPKDPQKSLILGTQKKAGLYVYDLTAKTQQFVPAGKINNVDLRNGFKYKNRESALVAGSNRSNNSISLFTIDVETARLSDTIANIKSSVFPVYGICLYKSIINGKFYVFVNGKDGKFEQWEILSVDDHISANLVRSFSVTSQPEGMVANDSTGILYLAIEEQGIAKINAEPDTDTTLTWLPESSEKNPAIQYDIEGIALYQGNQGTYLVASIQGNFSYAVWKINVTETYLTNFVVRDLKIDGTEETDGIEITSIPLSPDYPKGLLVVQDGFNFDGDSLVNQNFKYVSWEKVEQFLK